MNTSFSQNTHHARQRAQQRCIPPLIDEWLDRFGEATYDGHGGVIVSFSKKSIRKMEQQLGREPVQRFADKLKAYRVESVHNGAAITYGYRNKRLKRC